MATDQALYEAIAARGRRPILRRPQSPAERWAEIEAAMLRADARQAEREREEVARRAAIQAELDPVRARIIDGSGIPAFNVGALDGAGIYLMTFGATGDTYVGKSRYFMGRIAQHMKGLREGRHHCKPWQALADAHGLKSIEFRVLEYCERIIQNEREVYWIEKLKPSLNVAMPKVSD